MSPGLFRLFLASVVVLHHSFPLRLGSWAVGMFFVLSGYWIARMWRLKYQEQPSPYLNFLISRWWRLAPLFFSINLIAVLVGRWWVPVGSDSAASNPRWWLLQPLIAGSAQSGVLLPPAWSLDTEMQFYVMAPLIIGGLGAFRQQGVFVLLLLLALWGGLMLAGPGGLSIPRLDIFLWLFVLGATCDRFQLRPGRWLVVTSVGITSLIIAAVLFFSATRPLLWQRGSDAVDGATALGSEVLFVLMCLAAVPLAIHTVHRPSGAWDRWMGDLSYPLYLFHWLPRDWYYANVDWSQPAWRNGLLLLVNFLAAGVGATALLHLVDRPAQRLRGDWLRSRRAATDPEPSNPQPGNQEGIA